MKIAGCVVLYNPLEDCARNIEGYISLVDRLYIMDNSVCGNGGLFENSDDNKIVYVGFGENLGIAHALKYAADRAVEEGFDFLLTMDQDSAFPSITRGELEGRFAEIENLSDYGILGLNFNSEQEEKGLKEVQYWLTSGNFLNLSNYKLITGFKPELFIDYVDFDLCEQFYSIGKKVAYWQDLSLRHSIGEPKKYNILGIKFCVTNHSPVRYYYRFRNALYLYRQNKKFYKRLYRCGFRIDIPKIIFFEKNKREKLKMISLGRKDAKKGKLGKLEL